MNAPMLTASHYGVVHFGDLDCEAVVLTTGERGYVRKELAKLLGFHESHKGGRFVRFLADIAPNSLSLLEKSSGPILLPSGRQTQFFPAGIIADVATCVVDAAIAGTLHRARQGIVGNCLTIMRALATTGEVALIDEATGYQHHRAPDALQELISKLLRQSCASWERRFHPDYYRAIYRLFGWKYQGHDQNPPHVVGQITLRWVYGSVLPEDLLGEIRNRKGISHKHHQWLSDQGLAHLESQIHAVTAIARSSMSYPDFKRRCEAAFAGAALQLDLLLDELEEGREMLGLQTTVPGIRPQRLPSRHRRSPALSDSLGVLLAALPERVSQALWQLAAGQRGNCRHYGGHDDCSV